MNFLYGVKNFKIYHQTSDIDLLSPTTYPHPRKPEDDKIQNWEDAFYPFPQWKSSDLRGYILTPLPTPIELW